MSKVNKVLCLLFGLFCIAFLILRCVQDPKEMLTDPVSIVQAIAILGFTITAAVTRTKNCPLPTKLLTGVCDLAILVPAVFLARAALTMYGQSEHLYSMVEKMGSLLWSAGLCALVLTMTLHCLIHSDSRALSTFIAAFLFIQVEIMVIGFASYIELRREGTLLASFWSVINGAPLLDSFRLLEPDGRPFFRALLKLPVILYVADLAAAFALYFPYAALKGHAKAVCPLTGKRVEYEDVYIYDRDHLDLKKSDYNAKGKEILTNTLTKLNVNIPMSGAYTVVKQGARVRTSSGRELMPHHHVCPCHGVTVYPGEDDDSAFLIAETESGKTVLLQEMYVKHGDCIQGTPEYSYAKTTLVDPYDKAGSLAATLRTMEIALPLHVEIGGEPLLVSDMPGENSSINATIKKWPHLKYVLLIDMSSPHPLRVPLELIQQMEKQRKAHPFSAKRPKIVIVLSKCDKDIIGDRARLVKAMHEKTVARRSSELRSLIWKKQRELHTFIERVDRLCGYTVTVTACAALGSDSFTDRHPLYTEETFEAIKKG